MLVVFVTLNIVMDTQMKLHIETRSSSLPNFKYSAVPRLVRAPTVRTPCHSPASLLKSKTFVMVSPVNRNR